MAALLEAQRLAACNEKLAFCSLRPSCTRPVTCRPLQQTEQVRRVVATRAAASDAVAEPASRAQADASAAKEDDDFPDVAPEDLPALPTKDKYAVVEIGGVQMFVQEGRWYNVNRLEAEPGQTIKLGRVLAVKQDGKFNIGTPYLDAASVTAEVIDELKAPKVTIFKMNRKKHYRKKVGHRQPLTQFYVSEIKL